MMVPPQLQGTLERPLKRSGNPVGVESMCRVGSCWYDL